MCGLKVVITLVEHPVKFMDHLRQALDVFKIKFFGQLVRQAFQKLHSVP
jgi:hypothetical protein